MGILHVDYVNPPLTSVNLYLGKVNIILLQKEKKIGVKKLVAPKIVR